MAHLTEHSDRTILWIHPTSERAEAYQHSSSRAAVADHWLTVESVGRAIALCQSQPVDAIVLESLCTTGNGSTRTGADSPRFAEGLEQLQRALKEQCPPVIVLDDNDTTLAVRAIKAGAVDYLARGHISAEALHQALDTAIATASTVEQPANTMTLHNNYNKLLRRSRIFDALLSTIDDFVFVFNREGRFVFANQPLLDVWKLSLHEVVGKSLIDLGYSTELASKLDRQIAQVFATGQVIKGEFFSTRSPQGDKVYEYIFTPLVSQPGRVQFVVGSSRDVTAYKRIEAAAQEYAQRQAFLLRLNDVLRSLAEPTDVQTMACQLLGEELEVSWVYYYEYTENPRSRRGHPDHPPASARANQARGYSISDFSSVHTQLHTGKPLILADIATSTQLPVEERERFAELGLGAIAYFPLVKDERLVAVFCVGQASPRHWTPFEISLMQETAERTWTDAERTNAEAALRHSEEKYRTLFNSIDEGFCILERVPGDRIDFRLIEANPAFAAQSGIAHAVGKTMKEIFPSTPQEAYEIYANVLATGESIRFEMELPDVERVFELYASCIHNERDRLAVIFQNITARKLTESALRSNEERQAFLLKLTDAIRPLTNPADIQKTAARILGEYMAVDRAVYCDVVTEDGIEYYTITQAYHTPQVPVLLGTHAVHHFGPLVHENRAGKQVVVADCATDPRIAPETYPILQAANLRAWISIPLMKQEQYVAVLAVLHSQPRAWTAEEIFLIKETAERTWATVERARSQIALRESEEKYRSLFNSMDEGYILVDVMFDEQDEPVDLLYIDANLAATTMAGTELVGRRIRELNTNYEAHWFETFGRVAKTGIGERHEFYATPRQAWYNFYVFKMGDRGSTQVAAVYEDITERKRNEANAAFLAEVADVFSQLSTPNELMQAVGAKVGTFMNLPYCHFMLIDEEQDEVIFLDRWNADHVPRLPDRVCLSEQVSGDFYALVHSGQTVVSNNTQTNSITNAEANAEIQAISFITVPFLQEGEWKYLFSVHDVGPRHWRDDEIELVRELGNRLFPRLERARAEAALAEDLQDTRLLQVLSARLTTKTTFQTLYNEILTAAIALMRADAGSLQFLDTSTQELVLLTSQGLSQSIIEQSYRLNAESTTTCGKALATGDRTLVNLDGPEHDTPDGLIGLVLEAGYLSAQSTPLRSRSGALIGMVSTLWRDHHHPSDRKLRLLDVLARQAADLIEQRQSDIALQESEERLKRAIAIETVGIVFFDLEGPITEVNEAFLQMSGYSHAEIEAGQLRWSDLTPPDHWQTALNAFAELKSMGRTTPYEKELIRKDGSRWWGLCAATSLNSIEAVQFIVDISDRKQAEHAREQWAQELNQLNQRLEKLTDDLRQRNQDLNQFAYIVSHDLKAPLRGARNLAEWLQEDLGDQIPPDNQEQLQLLVRQVDRMNALISDLLEYSRAGRTKQQPEVVDVGELIEELITTWSVPPEVKIQFATPMPELEARRLNLEQVLSNLVGNAIKYGCKNQQGEVTIATREHGDWYEFAIADNGPGIEPTHHERIFGVFETLQPKADTGSTGIGLAIVKKLIEAEGGSIWVKSEPGAGATFYFTWPKTPQE